MERSDAKRTVPRPIRIIPAPDSVRDVIEARQAHLLERGGVMRSAAAYEKLKWSVFEDLRRRVPPDPGAARALALTGHLLPSVGPYQNPDHLLALVLHVTELLHTTDLMGQDWQIDQDLVLASSGAGMFNAFTTSFRDERCHLLMFNDGLFLFAQIFGNILTELFFEESGESLRYAVASILGFVTMGSPRHLLGGLPERFQSAARNVFTDVILRFVIAHELGHVNLGHTSTRTRSATGPSNVGLASVAWTEELEADAYASAVAATDSARHSNPSWFSGLLTELAQAVQVLIDDTIDLLSGPVLGEGSSVARTHPPGTTRMLNVQRALNELAARDPALHLVAEEHDRANRFLEVLRERIARTGQQAIDAGVGPHITWLNARTAGHPH